MFFVFIIKTFLFLILQLLEQIITEDPLLMASSINFSPFVLVPFIAKKIKFFLTFLLFVESPEIRIFSLFLEIFLIRF